MDEAYFRTGGRRRRGGLLGSAGTSMRAQLWHRFLCACTFTPQHGQVTVDASTICSTPSNSLTVGCRRENGR